MTAKFFKIETAKRTDIYSFRLRVWRVMLDGDPFEPLDTYNGETEKDRRSRRNEALAALKHEDKLTDHVCDSSKRSGILSEQQLATVLRVIRSYSGAGDVFREKGFIVHPEKNISAIQEAAQLQLHRAHGMRTEVSGLFLFILANFMSRERIDFRSDGTMRGASALEIAAVNGNVHAVKALAKKDAHRDSGETASNLACEKLKSSQDFLTRKHLERCIFIIENWAKDPRGVEKTADGWTKLRTLDESNIRSSWEIIAWEWKLPDKVVEEEGKEAKEEEQ